MSALGDLHIGEQGEDSAWIERRGHGSKTRSTVPHFSLRSS
jgi:hypothetical protein